MSVDLSTNAALPSGDPFDGGGDMGRLLRQHDWSRTPLGPPETWPSSLRTVVRILLTSRFAMWMGWGPDLTFLYNDAYAAMTLGAKHPWALGRPSREVWAEIWPQIGPRLERVLTSGEATWDERLQLFLERNGYPEETYHTFSYSPLPDDDGRIRGNLCVVSEETARVLGERRLATLGELGAQLASARETSEVYRAAERAAAKGAQDLPFLLVYELDDQGMARLRARANVAETARLGDVPFVELAGACGLATDGEPTSSAEVVSTAVPPLFRHVQGIWPQAPTRVMTVPLRVPGQIGPMGLLVAGVNPFRQLDAEYENFVALFAGQISAGLSAARATLEERRRAEALAELDRAKTVFFANMSHEFRTPLTLMLGPTEDALASPGQALAGTDLAMVHRNQLRLLKLVNALLDFSRLEAGRIQARFAPIDLAAETAGLAGIFRSAIERAGLSLDVDCAPLPDSVFVDRTLWERIVLNLMSNALKFTFEGGITVRLRADRDEAILEIEDTGVGIPSEALPFVFDRFHRVDGARSRTHEGSGIGLALVQDLVALHGGRVSADSVVGRGSRFSVRLRFGRDHLPAEAIDETPAAAQPSAARAFVAEAERWLPEAAPAAADGAPAPRSGFVLIADDNADMRDYTARLLGAHWQVEVVADGAEALAVARARRPDLIVSDVMMPGLDGFGLLDALRRDPATADIPLLMLSARAGEEARAQGLESGADDYLAKPFSGRELVARVATRLAMAQARRQVQSERDRLQGLLRDVPAIINFLSGPDLVIEFAHPMAEAALGGRELRGKRLLDAIPEFAGQPYVDQLREVYRTGQPQSGQAVRIGLDRSGTGALEETFWNYTYLPVRDGTGAIEGVMTFDLEVTDQVRTQRGLLQATRAKDEFLAMLGHELRNPLAPIVTALQLMKLKQVPAIETERALIERQTAHLTRLVDDLLDVARIASGRIELKVEIVPVAAVVARAVEIASPLLETRGHRLELDLAASDLMVAADPARLAQAVANLLTNAAKYSEPGARIIVRGRAHGDDIELAVRDHGIGIPADLLPHVFDVFVQGRQSLARSQGGLGLGLAIVRNIVERHGGTVSAASDGPQRGSEFVIRLPLAVVLPSTPAPVTPGATARPSVSRHVLVVDDNHDGAETLATFLMLKGHRVQVAADAPAALTAAAAHRPEIALIDIGLPGMDGYELAARLQDPARFPPMTLIAVTGYGQPEDRARTEAAGFAAHLVKPIDLPSLDELLSVLP